MPDHDLRSSAWYQHYTDTQKVKSMSHHLSVAYQVPTFKNVMKAIHKTAGVTDLAKVLPDLYNASARFNAGQSRVSQRNESHATSVIS